MLFVKRWEPVFQGERILLSIDRTKQNCFVQFKNTKRGKFNYENQTDFKNDRSFAIFFPWFKYNRPVYPYVDKGQEGQK